MTTSNRTETTGKRDVRREIAARILTVDARIEAMRMQVRDTHSELLQDVDQARLQMLAQHRIAARDRSTLPALRAAGDAAVLAQAKRLLALVVRAYRVPVDKIADPDWDAFRREAQLVLQDCATVPKPE